MENISDRKRSKLSYFILLISLSSPLSRIIVFGIGLIILALIPTKNLNVLPVRSIWTLFGIYPYSTGITRSVSMILHGDFQGAYKMNFLSFIVMVIVLVLLVKDLSVLIKTKRFRLD